MNARLRAPGFTLALAGTLLLGACGSGAPAPSTAAGVPVAPAAPATSSLGDFPDPFVLADGGGWYAYATNASGRHVQAAHSTDLRAWKPLPDAMPTLASWVRQDRPDVWAPEVVMLGERYVLYYTAREHASGKQCIGAAVATAPGGPFRDPAGVPLVCQRAEGGTIDASPLAADGRLYLYFKNDGNCCGMPTHLYAQELSADGLALKGAPVPLLRNQRGWEGGVVEAPSMYLHQGRHLLFYSANDYGGSAYAVGYVSCAGPMGPCQAGAEAPLLHSRGNLIGPGHQHLFDAGGQTWIAYHAWEQLAGGAKGDRRFMYIDKLDWVDGAPLVRGPTMVP
ncbi:glycoside hydrolase family 43 protein [Pseudoduganella lutea]|uniref:Glycoside hydrolase n=1 Tax=Pseudoduganella lutea TaxID=321985 RepID=A0A4P6KT99_9BURK|nr:glycoside hydrolase family 43 protein [Pseudoduganella lutea]QBE61884.1 glycoside hydrolase [Pseudoduganella lutea]